MSISSRAGDCTPTTSALPTDEEIIARIRGGETALYELLMRRYNQRLFRIARGILRDDDEAQDVMQDAYVRAFRSLDQFAGEAQFSTWLAKIAVYEAYRRARKQKQLQSRPANQTQDFSMDTVKSFEPNPEQQALNREAAVFLEHAISALPAKYRSVFMLRQIEGMSTAETAACLEITEESAKVRLLRARQMLRSELYARAGASSSRAFQFRGHGCDRLVASVLKRILPHDSSSNLYSA